MTIHAFAVRVTATRVVEAAMTEPAESDLAARVGGAGLVAMLVTHLVWDPALTLLGVGRFGIAAEGTPFVRDLLRIHPVAWLVVKFLVVGGGAALMYRAGIHREWATAWGPWVIALLGFVAPLGWLRRLFSE